MENEEEKTVEEVSQEINIEKTPTVDTPFKIKKKVTEKIVKKRLPIGRKPKIVKETKIRHILQSREMTRKDLERLIKKQNPNNPMSPDAISRIVNGSRLDYKLSTLYRLCQALTVAPNDLLNWEEDVKLPTNNEESKDQQGEN